MNNELLSEITEKLKILYSHFFPEVELAPYLVTFSDDLNYTHGEIRPDIIQELGRKKSNENGRIVLPYSTNEPIHILIKNNNIEGSIQWYETFAHELTHCIDYYQMGKKEKLESYKPLERIGKYSMFLFWTEYNARKKGQIFFKKMCEEAGCFTNTNEQVDYIIDTEWPTYLEYYRKEFINSDGLDQIYETMQLIGRYSAWCDLFPDAFNYVRFSVIFKGTKWMINLFSFLREYDSLDTIYNEFNEMEMIIRENWQLG